MFILCYHYYIRSEKKIGVNNSKVAMIKTRWFCMKLVYINDKTNTGKLGLTNHYSYKNQITYPPLNKLAIKLRK